MKVTINAPLQILDHTLPGEDAIGHEFMQAHGLQRDEIGRVTLPAGEYDLESRNLIAGEFYFIQGTLIGAHSSWWAKQENAEVTE